MHKISGDQVSNQNFYKMYLIRLFEISLLNMFHKGYLTGTTHTCIGQEAIPVALQVFLQDDDIVLSNHRCHGHYLARTDDVEGLLLEILGHPAGICKGRGGSQHLYQKNFLTNGVQGNLFPVSVGMAYRQKQMHQKNIVVIFIGDGTFGQGVVYESLNLASLLQVPLLIVVENNQYAQSTSIKLNLAGTLLKRADAFNVSASEIESNDVDELVSVFDNAVQSVRRFQAPFMQIIKTYRLAAHSKGDDCRDSKEIAHWRNQDPIRLKQEKMTSEEYDTAISLVDKRITIAMHNLSEMIDVKKWEVSCPGVRDYAIY